MKKVFTLLALALAMPSVAQTQYTVLQDRTSMIQNADFKADDPVSADVRTYDYDMDDDGVGAGGTSRFGQQAVTGWTATNQSDNIKVMHSSSDPAREDGANARAGGIFPYYVDQEISSIPGLGGVSGSYYAVAPEEGSSTQGLGMVAVWGAEISYTQEITLPAGAYMIIQTYYNAAGASAALSTNFGFKANDGQAFMSNTLSYIADADWHTDTAFVRVKAETAGVISLGYKSGNYGSGGAPHLFIDKVELYEIDPTPLDKAEIDEAKVELLKLIEEGEDIGVDVSDAVAVYDDPNATMAQVLAAIENQKAINEAGVTDLSDFFITNPHFTLDTPIPDDNGITTYDYDMVDPNGSNGRQVDYFGMQPVEGWTSSNPNENARACGVFAVGSNAFLGGGAFLPPTTMSDGSTTGKVLGFVSVWSAKSQYVQYVTIPAGKYTLTISYYNAGGTGAVSKNLMGFVADDGSEFLGEETTFAVGKWLTETIKFELDEETSGYFTMGYTAANAGSGSMPHFFIDGISLIYSGILDIDPSLFALQATVKNAEPYVGDYYYTELKEQFEQAVSEAAALVSAKSDDAEANKAAQDAINELLPLVKENLDAYYALEDFLTITLNAAELKYESLQSLEDRLLDLDDEINDALRDYNWDTETINAKMASLETIIKEETQVAWEAAVESKETLDDDLDISPLFDTLGYTYSTTAQQGTNVPDKQWNYGDASNFKTQYGTAEVWNQSPFKVSQTLTDMPAGKYIITTRAFYRTSDNETNYANYDPNANLAFVFAGNNKTPLANVVEVATTEADLAGYTAVGDKYVPNSQQAARYVFENKTYKSTVSKSVATVLTEQGDLTFGITANELESNSWVIWYTFEIAYNAVDEETLNSELEALIEDAEALLIDEEDELNYSLVYAGEALEQAINDAKEVDAGDIDALSEAATNLAAAIEGTKQSIALLMEFRNAAMEYQDRVDNAEFSSNDTHLQDILDLGESGEFQSDAEIQGYLDELPLAWVNFVLAQDGFDSASEEDPLDITGVIMNPNFDSGNVNYWTITGSDENGRIGQNQGYQSNNTYTNDEKGIVINQFIEAWRPSGAALSDGTISQTLLAALPAGSYSLQVDGFATNQSAIPEEGIQGAYLMVDERTTPIGIDVTGGVPEHFEVQFVSDGVTPVTVGLIVYQTNASWIVADNFSLYYLGTEISTGVNSLANANIGSETIYTVSGTKVAKAQKGLYIVVRDGKAQKVLVK